jgi:hypothetical protein
VPVDEVIPVTPFHEEPPSYVLERRHVRDEHTVIDGTQDEP